LQEAGKEMKISTPAQYSAILKGDFAGFTHRAFVELNPATSFLHNWHIDLLAEKLEDVRLGASGGSLSTSLPVV
jgi:hypothetical protein